MFESCSLICFIIFVILLIGNLLLGLYGILRNRFCLREKLMRIIKGELRKNLKSFFFFFFVFIFFYDIIKTIKGINFLKRFFFFFCIFSTKQKKEDL